MPVEKCEIPPEGWACSRGRDHGGPCAAYCLHDVSIAGFCANGCGRLSSEGELIVPKNAGYAPYVPVESMHACLLCAYMFPTSEIEDHIHACASRFQQELALEMKKRRRSLSLWSRIKRRLFGERRTVDFAKIGEIAEANARTHAREPRNSR